MSREQDVVSVADSSLDGWSLVDGSDGNSHGYPGGRGEETSFKAEVALEQDVMSFSAAEDFKAVLSVVAPAGGARRAPLRLVAVLDKSGSMSGQKIRLVKQTMIFMLRYLTEQDSLGLVDYGSEVNVVAQLTKCDQDGRQRLTKAIERICIDGQTNLSGGLLKGLSLHKDLPTPAVAAAVCPMQKVQVGNCCRRLEDADRTEWTVAVRFACPEEEAYVRKVVFQLHETFQDPIVEVTAAPFQLTRVGWGVFKVKATLHLRDGRELQVFHMLSFDQPETFRTLLLPLTLLKQPTAEAAGEAAGKEDGVVRSTFLFTDGLANLGITQTDQLCSAAAEALEALEQRKSSISTFGFGKDHNAAMLRSLADVGEGTYSYVETEEQIAEAFGEALGGLLSTTHQNVSLSLQLAPGVVFQRAYTSFPVEPVDGGVRVDLGDLYAEERRDILLSLSIPETSSASLQALGRMEVRGFSLLEKRSETVVKPLMLERKEHQQDAAQRHHQVERHWNRHITNEALAEARRLGDGRNDLGEARKVLEEAEALLKRSPLVLAGDATSLGFLSDLAECLQDVKQGMERYRSVGSKKMAMIHGCHGKQRAANGADIAVSYSNAMMKECRADFQMNIR